jgi:alkylation response protein AidB-like acyl-CoA dehydrogenase
MLRDSVARFARKHGGVEQRRRSSTMDLGFVPGNWQQFASQGWLGAIFGVEAGGFGGGLAEMTIIMEEIGRGLLTEPYLGCVVLGGTIVDKLGSPQQKQRLLEPMIGGELRLALAFAEASTGYDLNRCKTVLRKSEAGYVLEGTKIATLNGDSADTFLVTARTEAGLDVDTIAIVRKDAEGLSIRGYPTVDGLRGANLEFASVAIAPEDILGSGVGTLDALQATIDAATVGVCAEAIGAMSELLQTTADYLKTRKQFGKPLSTNQALQHRLVDMYIVLEEARALLSDAVNTYDPDRPRPFQAATSAVKSHVGVAARLIGQEAVQLHGAIGTTEELIVGHYFKRLTVIDLLFGNRDWHLRRLASQNH